MAQHANVNANCVHAVFADARGRKSLKETPMAGARGRRQIKDSMLSTWRAPVQGGAADGWCVERTSTRPRGLPREPTWERRAARGREGQMAGSAGWLSWQIRLAVPLASTCSAGVGPLLAAVLGVGLLCLAYQPHVSCWRLRSASMTRSRAETKTLHTFALWNEIPCAWELLGVPG